MEELLRQECLAESQLETYKSQLALVDQQLEGASETDAADLKQLGEDLSQLIALTEESLMDVKKQRLLLSLQGLDSHSADKDGDSVGEESKGEEAEGEEEEEEEREVKRDSGESERVEDDNELQGIKCRAPLEEAWGAVNYHNAVILGKENRELDEKDVKVRVLFTHPTHNAMKPCSYYLEGNCKFDDQTCKFSHGHVVPFSGLLTYQEPDYSLACIGGKCIAKYTDDLWYPGIISSFDETFTIHFTTLNSTIQTSLENVVPLESSESSESSASSENEEDEDEGEREEGGVRVLEWTPTGAQRALGEWEKYTTGIGSRLLAKMGYVVGKGLGRDGEGRIEPVEIKILPAGKSLDVCAEMREAGKIRKAPGEVGKGRRRRKKRKLVDVSGIEEAKEEKVNIFDFLNAKLKKTQTDPTGVDERRSSGSGSGNLNVQLFTVQEEIKSVLRRRHSLMAQLARHKGRDKTMEAHVTEKLAAADKQLERLQREEKSVEKKIALKTERKRLRIF